MVRPALPRLPAQSDVLILGNGPSLRGRPWATVPRDTVFIFGINQSWRELADVDAHYSTDHDQFDFDNPTAAGYGGRAYYEALDARQRVYHPGPWANHGIKLDMHNALVFSRRPFLHRHRGAHVPQPALEHDGGVALKTEISGQAGSSAYVALQIAAASGFDRVWFVGLDMTSVKFDGAHGYTGRGKKVPATTGAWSNSDKHDTLWSCVPADVRDRVRVIAPSLTKVFSVVDWPWPGPRGGNA